MLADVVPVGLQFAELQWPYILSCNFTFCCMGFCSCCCCCCCCCCCRCWLSTVSCIRSCSYVYLKRQYILNLNVLQVAPNPQSNFSWPFGTTPSQCRTYTACGWCSSLTDVHHAHARSIYQNGHMYCGRLVRTGRTLHETLALFASPHILVKLPSPKRGPRRGELARTPRYWPFNQIDWSGSARTRCTILFLLRR